MCVCFAGCAVCGARLFFFVFLMRGSDSICIGYHFSGYTINHEYHTSSFIYVEVWFYLFFFFSFRIRHAYHIDISYIIQKFVYCT